MEHEASQKISPEEYLALERKAPFRSEYANGEVFAHAGASRTHNLIVANALACLHAQLAERACEVYSNDMRVGVAAEGPYLYPDVVVVCGGPVFSDEHSDTLLNPTLIIEVLSESTEAYDRGGKFAHYRLLASLQEYLLVSQTEPRVERFARQPDEKWLLSEVRGLEGALQLDSIGCGFPMQAIYAKTRLPP
jgi:Uma2 family endonuclease